MAKTVKKTTAAGKSAKNETSVRGTKKSLKKTIDGGKGVSAGVNATRKRVSSSPKTALVEIITAEKRRKLIAVAAYLKAEKRGFAPHGELQDWLEAEKEISALLS